MSTLQKVLKRLNTGGHTYAIEPVNRGQPQKTVNRRKLLYAKSLVEDMESNSMLPGMAKPEAAARDGSTADESDSNVEFYMDDMHACP